MVTPVVHPVQSNEVQVSPNQESDRIQQNYVREFYEAFWCKEFMLHQAHGLPSFVTENAYREEEMALKKTVLEIPISKIPEGANVINSHVFYRFKKCDDYSLVLKARIAPHGNEDKDKLSLKTDSATCLLTGIRLLLSLALVNKWILAKIDFESAFLQTGDATRDVYVVLPRECTIRYRFYWLLLASAYGLVNASAKWQALSDNLLSSLGFIQLVYVPQLFYRINKTAVKMAAVRVVDDVLFVGPRYLIDQIISKIQRSYELGTIVNWTGLF